MAQLLLYLHLGGAVATLAAVLLSVRLLAAQKSSKRYIQALAGIGLFQLVTGAGLVFASPGASLTRLCVAGGAYLLVIGAVEGLLIKRLRTLRTVKQLAN